MVERDNRGLTSLWTELLQQLHRQTETYELNNIHVQCTCSLYIGTYNVHVCVLVQYIMCTCTRMYSVYTCTCIYMYNMSIAGVSQSAPHLQSYSSYRVFHITYGTYGLICASFHAFIFHFDFHVLNKKANQCLYTSMGLTIIVQHSHVHSPSCCGFWLVFRTKSTQYGQISEFG